MNISENDNENVLVITDAFSKFSVAVVIPDQTVKTVTKVTKYSYASCSAL